MKSFYRDFLTKTPIWAIFWCTIGFAAGAGLILETEVKPLRARLAHYQEVTHTTPPLCVEGEVRP